MDRVFQRCQLDWLELFTPLVGAKVGAKILETLRHWTREQVHGQGPLGNILQAVAWQMVSIWEPKGTKDRVPNDPILGSH